VIRHVTRPNGAMHLAISRYWSAQAFSAQIERYPLTWHYAWPFLVAFAFGIFFVFGGITVLSSGEGAGLWGLLIGIIICVVTVILATRML
jgi:hypothetical protein